MVKILTFLEPEKNISFPDRHSLVFLQTLLTSKEVLLGAKISEEFNEI